MAGEKEQGKETLAKTLIGSGSDSGADEDMQTVDSAGGAASSRESDSDEGDDVAERRLQTLEGALKVQPMDYDSHVEYIKCLRKAGEIEKLKKAREEMSKLFPLTPKLWQDWISDELSLNQGAESYKEIENLYERAVQDYLSVSLWLDYLNFTQDHDSSVSQCAPAGVSKMRDLFERAITAAGLHFTEGSKIWEAFREFEQALVLTFGENETEEKAKQTQRVRSLFHRQLAVPLADLNSTLEDYKLWEADQGKNVNETDLPPNVATNYKNATEALNVRKLYEDRIADGSQTEEEKLQHYMNYIKFEESSGNPARVQILYERAISEFQVSSDLWMAYTNYVDTLKLPSISKNVYYRATRNCTWVGELWACYLLSLERANSFEEEIRNVFEWAIQCTFQTVQEYLELYLTRVDGLRRRFSLQDTNNTLDFQVIRKTFMDASDSLATQLSFEELLNLHEYWAELEINFGKDIIASRSVWENLIKKSGSMLEAWKGYISMEINLGNINEARSIYKRCYSKKFLGTGSEDICNAWIRFERKYGSLEDYDFALKKVKPRLNELMIFKTQQENKAKTDFTQPAKMKNNNINNNNSPLKRKQTETNSKPPVAKKRKENAPKNKKSEPENHQPMEIEKEKEKEIEKGKEIEIEKGKEKEKDNEHEKEEEKEKQTKEKIYKDQCTAFVSNLHLDTSEEQLRSFFGENGGVIAVRLLKNKFTGGPRGLAYVDFSDENHLENAIAKNRKFLLEKRLSIAKSDPSRGRNSISSPRGRGGRKMPFRSDRNRGRENEEGENPNPKPNRNPNPRNEGSSSEARGNERVTFAAPRAVLAKKPLGWNKKDGKIEASGEELKSNHAFRDLFLKK